MIRVHALSEVTGGRRGIHILFCGPPAWICAPPGWSVQRRLAQRRRGDMRCAILSGATLAELRRERELTTPIGVATLRDGTWLPPAGGAPGTAEVLAIDLTAPTTTVRVVMAGPNWTAYGLFHGKVVAAAPARTQAGQELLDAPAIDRVVVHAQHASSWQICALVGIEDAAGWHTIAKLQLPIREVVPSLTGPDAEFELAKQRLIDGDELDAEEFGEIADGLRGLGGGAAARPIDWSIRPDPASPNTVLGALDPLRLALLDPTLRRAIGMAHFDDDPALVQGETYQYRVSAAFPANADIARAGFSCIPVGTLVPADFFFGDIHVRLARPSRVEFVPTHMAGDMVVGRRGISFQGGDRRLWLLPDLQDAGIVLDFAVPRTSIIIEALEADLQFDAYDAGGGGIGVNHTAGMGEIALTFGGPCTRLVLRGKGRWLGLRDGSVAITEFATNTQPVLFAASAGPQPPLWVRAVSTNTAPASGIRPRSELGFDVAWQPPSVLGAIAWPPDADAPPLLEATRFEIEHAPDGQPFSGVFGDGGAAYGQRGDPKTPQFGPGTDAMVLFAEDPSPPSITAVEFAIRDQFEREPPIPTPAPGTMHRYRIRSIDEIGRPSAWVTSLAARLEKHAPPPVPVGPPPGADDNGPRGVQARILVRGAPDLTDAEVAVLDDAAADTAIVLRWGWTAEQRDLDPWATEFRLYATEGGIGAVGGEITAVSDLGAGRFDVTLTLRRAVATDSARGGFLPAGGEYRILAHSAGTTIHATVETRLPAVNGSFPAPRIGPTELPVRWTPGQNRPDVWDERIMVVPITGAESYQHVLYDRLMPTAERPRDVMWVGVSAADAQAYIPDSRPGGGLFGNESPIVGLRCEARYCGRPDLVVPPPIGDVPVVITARSTTAGITHDVDLLPYLTGSPLAAGERVVVERVDDGVLLSALRSNGSDIVGMPPDTAPPDADELSIMIPNPTDRAAIVAALAGPPDAMADRYLVWLAARHPYADWLFAPLPDPAILGTPVRFTLPAGGARYVARVRRVDAAGHRSTGSATCTMVLRVPALAPLAPPDYGGSRWTTTTQGPRLEFTANISDQRATHLLTWIAAADPRRAALATIGSRRDLPGFGVRLRLRDGTALTPDVIVLDSAAAADRTVTTLRDIGTGPHFVWLAAVDGDGVPSALTGGYRLARKEA